MTFLDSAQDLANKVSQEIKGKVARYQNQNFRDACMATCALVAMADGILQDDERKKVIACIQNNEALSHFSATVLRDLFIGFCEQAKDDFTKVEAIKAIRKVKAEHDFADMVVKIGIIIAKSDKEFADVEKAVIKTIISELGLNETDYDLGGARTTTPSVSQPTPVTQPLTPWVLGSSLKTLAKGERVSLKQVAGTEVSELQAGLSFANRGSSCTAAIHVYGPDKTLIEVVDIQNRNGSNGAVVHQGNTRATSALGDDEEISFNLAKLANQAVSLLFVIKNTSQGQTIKELSTAVLRLLETSASKRQLLHFSCNLQTKPQAFVLARVYRHNNEWKVQAVGEEIPSQSSDTLQKVIASLA
jgi:tellurite resistance protein TerB